MRQGQQCEHQILEIIAICLEEQCQHSYCENCETTPHPHNKKYKFNKEIFVGQQINYSTIQMAIEKNIEEIKQFLDNYLLNIKNNLQTIEIIQQQLNSPYTVDLLQQIKYFAQIQDLELIRLQGDDIKEFFHKIKNLNFDNFSQIQKKSQYCEDSGDEQNLGSQQNQGNSQSSHNFGLMNFSVNQNSLGEDQQVSVYLYIDRQQTQMK